MKITQPRIKTQFDEYGRKLPFRGKHNGRCKGAFGKSEQLKIRTLKKNLIVERIVIE